jgi:hypothetical protein
MEMTDSESGFQGSVEKKTQLSDKEVVVKDVQEGLEKIESMRMVVKDLELIEELDEKLNSMNHFYGAIEISGIGKNDSEISFGLKGGQDRLDRLDRSISMNKALSEDPDSGSSDARFAFRQYQLERVVLGEVKKITDRLVADATVEPAKKEKGFLGANIMKGDWNFHFVEDFYDFDVDCGSEARKVLYDNFSSDGDREEVGYAGRVLDELETEIKKIDLQEDGITEDDQRDTIDGLLDKVDELEMKLLDGRDKVDGLMKRKAVDIARKLVKKDLYEYLEERDRIR